MTETDVRNLLGVIEAKFNLKIQELEDRIDELQAVNDVGGVYLDGVPDEYSKYISKTDEKDKDR